MKCPHCEQEINPEQIASLLGSLGKGKTSDAKKKSSAENGKKGGRPPKQGAVKERPV